MNINEKFEELYEETKLEEHCGECEMGITEEVSVKEFDALKKGDTVTIEFKSPMSTGKATFKVTAKNVVGKARIEKVTLKDVKRPSGVKFFLYKRGNKVSLAQGDMAASVVSFMKEDKDLEKMVKELEGASKMHLGQSKRIAKYLDKIKDKKEEVKLDEILKPGDRVKVMHPAKGKGMVTGKIVRYDKGGPESPFYIVAIPGLARSEKVPAHKIKEDVEIKEYGKIYARKGSDYELYHKTFSGAMQHAYDHAKKKGFTVDPKEIDNKVATGPKKPSSGKTNRYILGTDKRKKVHIQVANLDNKRYELNMYIESVINHSAIDKVKRMVIKEKYETQDKMFPKTLMDGIPKAIPGVKLSRYSIKHPRTGKNIPGLGLMLPGDKGIRLMIQFDKELSPPPKGMPKTITDIDPETGRKEVTDTSFRDSYAVWINDVGKIWKPNITRWIQTKDFRDPKKVVQFLKTKVKRLTKEEVEIDEKTYFNIKKFGPVKPVTSRSMYLFARKLYDWANENAGANKKELKAIAKKIEKENKLPDFKEMPEIVQSMMTQEFGIKEEVELDEVNLAKVTDDSLRKRMKQLRTGGKTDMPSIQFGIKQISKEMKNAS